MILRKDIMINESYLSSKAYKCVLCSPSLCYEFLDILILVGLCQQHNSWHMELL